MSTFGDRVRALVPTIRERALATEKDRQISVETMAQLRDAGVFRAFVPRSYGGDERSPSEVFEAMTDLARGCSSTAWVASLLATHNFCIAWLEKAAQEEIFASSPDPLIPSSVAPMGKLSRVEGGFKLSGKWGFSSGVDHGNWLMLGGLLKEDGAPQQPGTPPTPPPYYLLFLPSSEFTIDDDWHVAGLRGTGSKSVVLNDVFIPSRRAITLKTVIDGTAPGFAISPSLYRIPWSALFQAAFVPVALGTSLAMLEGFRETTASRVGALGTTFKSNAGSLMRLAETAAQLDAARALFRRDMNTLDRVGAGEKPLAGTAERVGYNAVFIVDSCSRIVDRLFRGSGGRALQEKNPFQRYFRDLHAMTQHAAFDMDVTSENYGRALLGNPELVLGASV